MGRARVGPGFGPGAAYGSLSWDASGQTLALITSGPSWTPGCACWTPWRPAQPAGQHRLVLPTPTGPELVGQLLAPGDDQRRRPDHHRRSPGRRAARRRPRDRVTQKLVTFSASTGELLHTLNHIPVHGGYQQVLWASPSAQLLIVSGTQPGPAVGSFNLGHSAGTLSGGRFTPLPWSNRTFAAAW